MFLPVYPTLDLSDNEDGHVFKPRGRMKKDETWNPKGDITHLDSQIIHFKNVAMFAYYMQRWQQEICLEKKVFGLVEKSGLEIMVPQKILHINMVNSSDYIHVIPEIAV